MILVKYRLNIIFIIFLFFFLLSGIRAFFIAPFYHYEDEREKYFALLFTYLFVSPLVFLVFKKLWSEINDTCKLSIVNEQKLKFQYRFFAREINFQEISNIKLNISPELISQFTDESFKSLDISLRHSIFSFFGRKTGATLIFYKGDKTLHVIKNIKPEFILDLKDFISKFRIHCNIS